MTLSEMQRSLREMNLSGDIHEMQVALELILAIMNEPSYKKYFGNTFFTIKVLSRVPKGYPADWEHADLLKYKDYCTSYTMPDKMLTSPKLFDEVIKVWRASVPLNRFIQRAMEDVTK